MHVASIERTIIRVPNTKAVILLACILGEITCIVSEYGPSGVRQDSVPQRPHHASAVVDGRVKPQVTQDTAALASAILARPIFSATRRPVQGAALGSTGLPRLAGVLISRGVKTAIFADDSVGRSVAVAEGASMGPYLVQSIAAGQVTVLEADGIHTLHPSFDPEGSGRSTARLSNPVFITGGPPPSTGAPLPAAPAVAPVTARAGYAAAPPGPETRGQK